MTDDKEDKTLEHQEHFTEVAKSRDVEVSYLFIYDIALFEFKLFFSQVLEGKPQYIEFAGNLVPVTKSGEQLQFSFRAFKENRLPFSVRVKDQHAEAVGRCMFMKDQKVSNNQVSLEGVILNIYWSLILLISKKSTHNIFLKKVVFGLLAILVFLFLCSKHLIFL